MRAGAEGAEPETLELLGVCFGNDRGGSAFPGGPEPEPEPGAGPKLGFLPVLAELLLFAPPPELVCN